MAGAGDPVEVVVARGTRWDPEPGIVVRAESPQETRVRLLLAAHGLPAPVAQFEVRADGRFLARVDFGWPERRVALEYDGVWHDGPGQFVRDRQRLSALAAAG
ncbi:hypothetical protein O2V63_18845 [Modestobacter sp. VKM Ac-2977]|uniref:hypothetical protein n=1 Tax=Modestobacter sp. VKM Ac-2977 TaxID=3004131 RepID=UPI0022AB09BE|nr:hypothetical protein [Modestobacter sp. VKM Ac-2977]MCZ2822403.1 hypothetical protein [Modestobacter sp. VKM Ac-2977]